MVMRHATCLAAAVTTSGTEAQRHLAALERLERIIAAFASMVSHETRTALVGIQGLSELIRDGGLTHDEVRIYAGDIFGEALRIDAMIGEMFDLNRLETGPTPWREVLVDVNRVVGEAAAKFDVDLDLVDDRPAVLGDRDRLRQAFQKVLGFVVRTARPDSQIAIATTRETDGVGVLVRSTSSKVVEFEDWFYGRYERYEQRPSAVLGAGLGLAIARAIIELHGGRIEAQTAPPSGAEFRVRLPALAASAGAPARGRESTPSPSPPPPQPPRSTQ